MSPASQLEKVIVGVFGKGFGLCVVWRARRAILRVLFSRVF